MGSLYAYTSVSAHILCELTSVPKSAHISMSRQSVFAIFMANFYCPILPLEIFMAANWIRSRSSLL